MVLTEILADAKLLSVNYYIRYYYISYILPSSQVHSYMQYYYMTYMREPLAASAYGSIRQHASAYMQHYYMTYMREPSGVCIRQHTSAYVSIRQHICNTII